MNRRSILAILLALCVLLASACAASAPAGQSAVSPSRPAADDMAAATAEKGGAVFYTSAAPAPAAAQPADRKLVRTGHISLETMEFDADLAALVALIEQAGGYIEQQSVTGASLDRGDSYYERRASITARVPADQFDALWAGVDGICNVVSRSEQTADITEGYYDTDARLRSLMMQEERLLEILSKAEKLDDVILLEQALSDVRYQIESATSSLRRMDSQVSYSSLSMELREVAEYQSISQKPRGLGERVAAAWSRGMKDIADSLEWLLLFTVGVLPVLLLWAALLGAVAWMALRIAKGMRARKNAKIVTPPPAGPDDNA